MLEIAPTSDSLTSHRKLPLSGAMLQAVKHHSPGHYPDQVQEAQTKLLDDVQSRQRNIVWPDTMRNGRSVDALLWRGSPEATAVQRVGIAIFGLLFLGLGLFFVLSIAAESSSILGVIFGLFFVGVGVRVTLNAFRPKRKHAGQQSERHRS